MADAIIDMFKREKCLNWEAIDGLPDEDLMELGLSNEQIGAFKRKREVARGLKAAGPKLRPDKFGLSRHHRASVNSNGKFKIPDDKKSVAVPGYKTYVCKDFSADYLLQTLDFNGCKKELIKVNLQKYASETGVQSIDPSAYAKFEEMPASIVTIGRFGEFLSVHFKKMLEEGISRDGLYVSTGPHAMAADLEIKKGKQGSGLEYVVRFFDPNDTTTHFRCRVSDPSRLSSLGLEAFLPKQELAKGYWDSKDEVIAAHSTGRLIHTQFSMANEPSLSNLKSRFNVAFMCDDLVEMAHIKDEVEQARRLTREGRSTGLVMDDLAQAELLGARNKRGHSALRFAMCVGKAQSVEIWGELLMQSGIKDERVLAELLAGGDRKHDSALWGTMGDGRARGVKAWAELVLQSGIRNEQLLIELLAGVSQMGYPALWMAMSGGQRGEHALAIHIWGALVKKLNIKDQPLIELLAGKNKAGAPAVLGAMMYGCVAAMQAWGALVLRSGIKNEQVLAELLAGKNDRGIPVIWIGMKNKQVDAVKAWGKLVMQFGIQESALAELLAAKNKKGDSVLSAAMEAEYAEFVTAWGAAVLQSGLSDQALVELLAGKNREGVPGLLMAMQEGYANVTTAWGRLVLQSGLKERALAELLAGKGNTGVSALLLAMSFGHVDATKAWGELVLQSGLKEPALAKLLAGKGNTGVPALLLAMQNGHADAIKAWGALVLRSGLKEPAVSELLAGEDRTGVSALWQAMRHGQAHAVEVWGEVVKSGIKNEALIAKLLAAKGPDGRPAVWVAMQNGHTEAVKVWDRLVDQSGIQNQTILGELRALRAWKQPDRRDESRASQ
ncbi:MULTISPECIES: ShET2/EspL2 family type III secretion system effector toxin [unclassified Caballeronia]|uniref:ShET2/EspL2 family type III secretion system effector toxin n=1 Tax=unclassified Caballeronia TaxID=2646786 RepID=UPI002028CC30|nr:MULTISPECIES: ShET2/EspL2 family type III secretion system effector toxin [unclassified Caballeronia]